MANDTFHIVKSRPITTLYPIPEADDQENHVYVSVGHQQMMTDPMKPLGLSFFLLTTNAPMRKAGGRLFIDVTHMLASPDSREILDVIRPYPEVIDYLQHAKDDDFLEKIVEFDGEHETQDAILSYLNKYGMRCVGEIDIAKTRWSEKPTTLVPMILSNIKNFEPNTGHRIFEQERQEALKKEQEILGRNYRR